MSTEKLVTLDIHGIVSNKGADADNIPRCVYCGKAIKANAYVVMGVHGTIYVLGRAQDEPVHQQDSGYMGSWDVGPECGRKIRAHAKSLGLNPDDFCSK